MTIEIKSSTGFDRFTGKVESITLEKGNFGEQWHMIIVPTDVKVKGKTGAFHNFIPHPNTATDKTIPEGSILARYIEELKVIFPDILSKNSVEEALKVMVGKTFEFIPKKLGKSFRGYEAKEYFVPIRIIQ